MEINICQERQGLGGGIHCACRIAWSTKQQPAGSRGCPSGRRTELKVHDCKFSRLMWCRQERDEEAGALQRKLEEAEEAHEEELVDMQATVQACKAKLQDTKVLHCFECFLSVYICFQCLAPALQRMCE